MTGRFASTLYRTGVFFTNYFDSNDWITESMREGGIRTMSVQAHLYFDRAPGLKQGFDVYQMVPGLTWNAQTDESITSPKSVAEIQKLLENPENTKGQFFLWSHLMDPHDKYVKHEESPDFGKDNRGRYDSEVWFADHWLGQLFDFCEKQPWWDKTAVIITADHGEAFGEHGMYKHAFELWEVLARVPLIIKAPGASAKRISLPRTHLDLAPTILDLMKVPALDGFQGQSLAPELYDETPPAPRPAIVLELAEDTNNAARRAIIVGDHKLISFDGGAKKSLFNLKDDPGELVDLSSKQPELTKQLDQQLTDYFKGLPVVRPFGGNKLRSGKIADGPKGPPKVEATGKP
jgi:arylsulfatase A-like enzyme